MPCGTSMQLKVWVLSSIVMNFLLLVNEDEAPLEITVLFCPAEKARRNTLKRAL